MTALTTNPEKYCRLSQMLAYGGTKVARALFEKRFKAMTPKDHIPFPWTIDEFLHANKNKILSSQTGRAKKRIFFPVSSGTEIENWDLLMFCSVLVDVCGVSKAIAMDVDQLKKMSDKLLYLREPSIDDEKYKNYVDKIEVIFDRLLVEIDDQNLKEKIADVLQAVKDGPLSLQDALIGMHKIFSMEGDMQEILSQQSKDLKEMRENLREMKEKEDLYFKNQTTDETESVHVPGIEIELLLKNCVSDKEELISNLLVHMYKKTTGSSSVDKLSKEDNSKMMEAVRDTVERFTAKDRPIVDAEKKCVMLRIKCHSVASLLSLFDDCIDGNLNKEFKPLEACIQEIKGFEEVTLEAVMFENQVRKTISKIGADQDLAKIKPTEHIHFCKEDSGNEDTHLKRGKNAGTLTIDHVSQPEDKAKHVSKNVSRNSDNSLHASPFESLQASNEFIGRGPQAIAPKLETSSCQASTTLFQREEAGRRNRENSLLVSALDFGTHYSGWAILFKYDFERDAVKVSSKNSQDKSILSEKRGTIDTSAHEVKRRGMVEELHEARGGARGGSFVDEAFGAFYTSIGADVYKSFKTKHRDDFMDVIRNFEIKKKQISSMKQEKITTKMPASLSNLCKEKRGNNLKEMILQSRISDRVKVLSDRLIEVEDLIRKIFQPTARSIIHPVRLLLREPALSYCFPVVGGFYESPMLQQKFRAELQNFQLMIPVEADCAVLKGAIIFGQKPTKIAERVFKYTHGAESSHKYKDSCNHQKSRVKKDEHGNMRCFDTFSVKSWLSVNRDYGKGKNIYSRF